MATTTSALPDGTKLTKPAYTDSADIAVINTNMDNIANNINSLNSNINQFTGVPTDTYNGDLNSLLTPGWYLLGSGATNTPPHTSTGKLKVEKGGTDNYIRQTYYGGYNYNIYTRVRYYSNGSGWLWTDWQEVTNSQNTMEYIDSGFTSADGRYYTRKLTFVSASRFPIMVLRCSQSSAHAPVGGSVNNTNGYNEAYFSDSTVTWDKNTSVITVDNGSSAWAGPIVIFPKGTIT